MGHTPTPRQRPTLREVLRRDYAADRIDIADFERRTMAALVDGSLDQPIPPRPPPAPRKPDVWITDLRI